MSWSEVSPFFLSVQIIIRVRFPLNVEIFGCLGLCVCVCIRVHLLVFLEVRARWLKMWRWKSKRLPLILSLQLPLLLCSVSNNAKLRIWNSCSLGILRFGYPVSRFEGHSVVDWDGCLYTGGSPDCPCGSPNNCFEAEADHFSAVSILEFFPCAGIWGAHTVVLVSS